MAHVTGSFRKPWSRRIAPLAPQALETGDFGIVEPILVQKHVVHKEYNTHMVLHSLHIPNSQLYVSEPPPEWFGNGPNEVRSLWPTSYVSPNAHCALA